MLVIPPIMTPKYSLQARWDGVEMTGSFEMSNAKEVLRAFLKEVHEQASARGIKTITVDAKKLVFMNSSTLKEMTAWILKQKGMEPESVYDIVFEINPECSWQPRTFVALQWLYKEHIRIVPKT